MRRRLVVAPFLKPASIAAALMVCPLMVQAASVKTVFSAENALYGAGYSIGKADGWIDDRLRAAIREYQSGHSNLESTGELDEPTLAALGISAGRAQLMGGNSVASAEAARKELGLKTLASAPKPAPTRTPEPEPEPAPPAVTPEPVAEPEPQPEPESKRVVVASPPAPEPVATPEPEPAPEPETAQINSDPEPTSEPITIVANTRASSRDEPAPAAELKAEAVAVEAEEIPQEETVAMASVDTTPVSDEAVQTESTASSVDQEAVSSGSAEDSQSLESRGNVITRMFDFLFGWMV